MNLRITIIQSEITNMLFDVCPQSEIVFIKYKKPCKRAPGKSYL